MLCGRPEGFVAGLEPLADDAARTAWDCRP